MTTTDPVADTITAALTIESRIRHRHLITDLLPADQADLLQQLRNQLESEHA